MVNDSGERQEATKVLFVDFSIGFGGAIYSMSLLANSLANEYGLDVYVTTSQKRDLMAPLLNGPKYLYFPMPFNYVARQKLNQRISGLKSSLLRKVILKLYAFLDELATYCYRIMLYRRIKNYRIDLVHMNNGVNFEVMVTSLTAGVPCVFHSRGDGTVGAKERGYKKFNQAIAKVVAISEAVAESCQQDGVAQDKIRIIYNPIDFSDIQSYASKRDSVRQQWGVASSDIVVAMFGRIVRWKGQLEFLQAVESIIKRCPNLKVMIVGDSSDDMSGYENEIKTYAERESLRGRIIFPGYQREVASYYWASDIVVHNSIELEPFGRVIIEAMACGRPVIAMREGGPLDIITENIDGILVPPRDIEALSAAIEEMYKSDEDRGRLGINAAKSVAERFDVREITRQVLDVYAQVLEVEPQIA